MQFRRAKIKLLWLTGLSLLFTGCNISDWYNGYYVERSSIKEYLKESEAYLNAESPEKKELRKQNAAYCSELASKPENRLERKGYKNTVFNEPMYRRCMEDRGTPTYGTYLAIQAEKRDAERRARGKRVM
ncbi:hypothetical protein J3U68_07610 [Snodgrassella sp. B3882]|uniref:hypothetical protein n=1 Tax=Snodgrassella sp. B3882 TaxID=2818037 RepID=UPI002269D49D|nr:hypothetical protein [Snodgrassella sp. B3882]MCX8745272.1 hypothetical protein [Snodgrassella sp. B3882]